MEGSTTLPSLPKLQPPPTPPMPTLGGTPRRRAIAVAAVPAIVAVLVGAFAVRWASTEETEVVRHASTGRAPPTELALDKMIDVRLRPSKHPRRPGSIRRAALRHGLRSRDRVSERIDRRGHASDGKGRMS